jgi:hypothetical protein
MIFTLNLVINGGIFVSFARLKALCGLLTILSVMLLDKFLLNG